MKNLFYVAAVFILLTVFAFIQDEKKLKTGDIVFIPIIFIKQSKICIVNI